MQRLRAHSLASVRVKWINHGGSPVCLEMMKTKSQVSSQSNIGKDQNQRPQISLWSLGTFETAQRSYTLSLCFDIRPLLARSPCFLSQLLSSAFCPCLRRRFEPRDTNRTTTGEGVCGGVPILPALVSPASSRSSSAHFLPCRRAHVHINREKNRFFTSARLVDLTGLHESNFWNRFVIVCNHALPQLC